MDEFDEFWDGIIRMLEDLRQIVGGDRVRRYREDIDLVFDKDKRLIYVTMPFPDVKIKNISIEDNQLVIEASNGKSYYQTLDLAVPLRRVVEYSLNNGVLDITIEY